MVEFYLQRRGEQSLSTNRQPNSSIFDNQAPADVPPPIDYEWLAQCSGGERELEKEILDLFRQEAQKQLARIKVFVLEGNCAEVQKETHSLKGAAGNVGAVPVKEAAVLLEARAIEGDLEGMKDRFESLLSEYQRFEAFYGERSQQASSQDM